MEHTLPDIHRVLLFFPGNFPQSPPNFCETKVRETSDRTQLVYKQIFRRGKPHFPDFPGKFCEDRKRARVFRKSLWFQMGVVVNPDCRSNK